MMKCDDGDVFTERFREHITDLGTIMFEKYMKVNFEVIHSTIHFNICVRFLETFRCLSCLFVTSWGPLKELKCLIFSKSPSTLWLGVGRGVENVSDQNLASPVSCFYTLLTIWNKSQKNIFQWKFCRPKFFFKYLS